MKNKNIQAKIKPTCIWFILLICLWSGPGHAADLEDLFVQVEQLNIKRQGYVLGAALNPGQLATAAANPIDATTEDTFKFKDGTLYIVAQQTTNRVLVMYEQFSDLPQKKIQDLVGDLYMGFDDPTVLAHDRVVYWAWAEQGKISSQAFDRAQKDKKTLAVLATVKCISDIKIMENSEDPALGQVYYIISSDPILKFFSQG
jgi:hypothetical protein